MRAMMVAVLFFLAACCHTQPPAERSGFPDRAYQAVGSIERSPGAIVGAAVILRCRVGQPLVILTAKHVVDAGRFVRFGAERQAVVLLQASPDHDLALMVGAVRKLSCREVVLGDPARVGDTLWLIGSSARRHRVVSRGIVAGTSVSGKTTRYWSDAASYGGNSGGGAFDAHGRLVGIIVGGLYQTWGPLRSKVPGTTLIVHTRHLFGLVEGTL